MILNSNKSLELPLYDLRLSTELMNQLEPIEYFGNIIVVDNMELLDYAIKSLSAAEVVGFDTESRPAFIKGQKFPVSIIQLALKEEVFIFKLKYTGLSELILNILIDKNIKKIGVGISDDLRRLKEIKNFQENNFIDLSDIAKSKGIIQTGIKALTARYLGKKLIKSSQKTNWARNYLSERQLRYAATDAWVCLYILNPLLSDKNDYKKLYDDYLQQLKYNDNSENFGK